VRYRLANALVTASCWSGVLTVAIFVLAQTKPEKAIPLAYTGFWIFVALYSCGFIFGLVRKPKPQNLFVAACASGLLPLATSFFMGDLVIEWIAILGWCIAILTVVGALALDRRVEPIAR